jgi:hypothetical protein
MLLLRLEKHRMNLFNRKPSPGKAHSGRANARTSVAQVVAAGAQQYERERHLPRLLPLMPSEVADNSAGARRRIVARLARALRAERMRGRAGHWSYDLNRHIALSQAYVAERNALAATDAPPQSGHKE